MNTDTLNTSHPSRFTPDVLTNETGDLHNIPHHTLSHQSDEWISEDARSQDELERRNDAIYSINMSGNQIWDATQEMGTTKETGPGSPFPNVGQGDSEALTFFTDTRSLPFTRPTLPSTSQRSISTIRPIAHTQNKKYTSHIPTRDSVLTTSTSASLSHKRSGFLRPASRHGQAGPSLKLSDSQINSTLALNALKTIARIQEETILNTDGLTLFDSALRESHSSPRTTDKSVNASFLVRPKADETVAPSPTGGMPMVVPNTILWPHRSGFFASDTSNSSPHSWDNKSKNEVSRNITPLITQNFDHPVSRQIPPLFPQHQIQSPSPSNSIQHFPNSSSAYSNTNKNTMLSAPSPPSLPINPSLIDLCSSSDGYTSADAEGESVAASDSVFEFMESSVIDTQLIHSTSTLLQPSKQSFHKSVYELFTPPDTRQSSQVPSQPTKRETSPQRVPRSRSFMSHVEIPPLPKGSAKWEYRPFKRVKYTHDAEYSPGSESEGSWERERYGRVNGKARNTGRQSGPTTVRSSSVLSVATIAPSYVAYARQAGEPKTKSLSKPSVQSRKKPVTPARISTIGSTPTTHHPPSHSRWPTSGSQAPSPPELGVRKHRVHDAEHLSPVVAYFNVRHCQLSSKEEMTSWVLLGAQIMAKCTGPRQLSCVREISLDDDDDDDDDGFDQVDYRVGGPLSWKGCSGDKDEYLVSQSRNRQGEIENRSRLDGRRLKPNVVKQREPSQAPSLTQSLATPVPTLDLAEVKLKRDTKGRADSHTERSGLPPSVSPSQLKPTTPAAVEPPPKTRPYLSEKARGKQKAVDSDFVEPDFHGDLHSVAATPPTTNQGSFDVDILTSTTNNLTWPHTMEEYITFDASPVKFGGGSNSGDAGYAPNFAYAPLDTDQLLSSRTNVDDLFLRPPDVEPSIFDRDINLTERIDAYHSPYGMSMNVEKEAQPTTVNPTLLGGNTYDDVTDEGGLTFGMTSLMDGTDVTGIEDQRLQEVTAHGEQLPQLKAGYELILGSPIVSASRSSSSSSNVSPRSSKSSSTPVHSRSVSATLLGRTSSPEFSDCGVPTQARVSSLPGTDRSIRCGRTEASSPRRNILVRSQDEEEEEEEVRRGLEYVDAFSSSDDKEFIPISDLENESEDTDRAPPVSLRSRRKSSVHSSPDTAPSTVVAKTLLPARHWECGPIRSCCHFCRTSSNKLKMVCPCGLKYCNRCIALRFPDIEFRSKWRGFECPGCKDQCTCDVCTRKRGEEYVPLRRNREKSLQAAPAIIQPRQTVQLTLQPRAQPSSLPQLTPLPSSEVVEATENISFWGTIYDINGSKIAVGYADEDNEIVFANAVEGYTRSEVAESVSKDDLPAKRIFVGAYQPSWGLGNSPIIKDLRGSRRPRRINNENADGTGFRWYIGKENLLYCSMVARTGDLPTYLFSDMSSLSSLSDDSDVEADAIAPLSTIDKPSTSYDSDSKEEKKSIIKVDPEAIQANDTVHLLQIIARDICGMMGPVEYSLINT